MSSQSSFGLSQITLQFDLGRDIDAAAQDVQAAINAAASTLPRDLPYPPVYAKVNPADTPVLTLTLRSKTATLARPERHRRHADRAAACTGFRRRPRLRAGRRAPGDPHRSRPRPARGQSHRAEDLRQAVASANNAGAKGSLEGQRQSYTLDANDQILQAKQYETIIVAWRNKAPVMLRDVAKVRDGLETPGSAAGTMARQSIVLDVMRQPGAQYHRDRRTGASRPRRSCTAKLPAGMSFDIVNDRTDTIRASIHEVQMTLVIAAASSSPWCSMFLRSWRATLIAGVSLPLSIIATFFAMWAMAFARQSRR